MSIEIINNIVKINGHPINFNGKVMETVELANGNYLILKNIPISSNEINNLYCYSSSGDFIWRIEPSCFERSGKLCYAYEGLSEIDGEYFVVDFYGRRFYFNPETGAILKQDVVK